MIEISIFDFEIGFAFSEVVVSFLVTDKENGPRTINDLKLINAGKILENNRTLAESRLPVDLPGGVITMHVVVRPPLSEKNTGNSFTELCLTFTIYVSLSLHVYLD